ncbi:hypothetical protein FM104_02095 [Microbacterium esteraromaticum]|uniref:Uncharacterized protein n=1 Tax=Microbacterium esteraromaticum TaxID=57043 RepID=A0A1R4IGR7_9MICO|nr:hypothetical protein [Microbacterium esteraromaticum]SJN19072.1 hypothetical protein FM104_02095 [Microbacterium esteraromaticum]
MMRNDRLAMGANVPGVVLRLLAVAVAVIGGMLVGAPLGWFAIISAAAVFGAIVPQLGGVWAAAGAFVVVLLLEPSHPLRTAVAIAVVHLLHVLAALSLVVPLRARVTLRALMPTAMRFVLVQVICQGAAFAISLLPGGPVVPIAVIFGGGAGLLLALVVARMLRGSRVRAFSDREVTEVR